VGDVCTWIVIARDPNEEPTINLTK
jgi:hypothetical protein